MTDRPDNAPFAIGDEVHLKARRIGKVVAITEDPSDGQVVVVEWGPENGSNTVFRWNRAVDLERRRESDTTAPSDLRCIFCGNPYGNGHSPRCSVTKLGAPEQWWSPPPERERAPLYERSEIEAELIAEAFGVRDGIVEGKVAADAVITIRRLHAVAEAAREVVETARTYGLGQSVAWGGPNPEFPKSNWGKFELAVCRLMAIVPTDSSGEGHDHG